MNKRRKIGGAAQAAQAYDLLSSLSNDLTLPLVQIKTSLEILNQPKLKAEAVESLLEQMRLSTDSGLQLVEAYKLLLQAENNLGQPFEPVTIGAVLQDVAQNLT